MQIKRFEAADMTDALRLVKREFGDEAVILSAKEVRPRGFFSALRKKHVEITAATDYPSDEGGKTNDFSGLLDLQLQDVAPADRVSLSTPPQTTRHLAKETHVEAPMRSQSEKRRLDDDAGSGLIQRPATMERPTPSPTTINYRDKKMAAGNMSTASGSTRTRGMESKAAAPFFSKTDKRNIIALVGPSGAGKSTTLAKMAWHCRAVEKQRIGLVSLDRFSMGGNSLLQSVARILNLSLSVVHDAEGLKSVLAGLEDVDAVLIDTPGIGRTDQSMLDEVAALLRLANADETHLVANATVKDEVLAATVETYSSLGPNRILFTHMDECVGYGDVLSLISKARMPASFYADGTDLTETLQPIAVRNTEANVPDSVSTGGQVTAFPGNPTPLRIEPVADHDPVDPDQYLANRNSELFHHSSCKSVKRINAKNIAAFDSIEQAINAGFRPCRACCNINSANRTVRRDTFYRRTGSM